MTVTLADDDVAELLDRLHASASAECHGGGALLDATARNFGVLRLERSRHIGDSEVVGPEPIGIERHVDLPRPSTDDYYLADTADAFELPAQLLVGVLGNVADRLLRRQGKCQDRSRIGIELLDRGLIDRPRQERQHPVDSVADLLGGDVGVLLQQERDNHQRHAFRGRRAKLVDAADRVHRFLDLVGDLGFDLLRRRAGQARGDDDGRKVDFRKAVESELCERKCTDNREREDENGREDGALD